jgi:hypothetical protein
MDPTGILITVDLVAVLAVIYVLDRNVFHALGLVLSELPSQITGAWFGTTIRIRLWFDRQALVHRGPVGRLWNEYTLWRIRNNPAYREFFNPDNEA